MVVNRELVVNQEELVKVEPHSKEVLANREPPQEKADHLEVEEDLLLVESQEEAENHGGSI